MTNTIKSVSPAKWVLARWLLIGATALTIAGCGKTEDQPSAALPPVAEGAALTDAPSADSLPPAPAAPVYRVADAQASYAYPDRAYEMSDTFGDAPPDYVYDYGDVQPWVWVSEDGSERMAEAVPGGERYYYYEAGADQPFFIQDPTYGYGFQGGRLIAVYDRSGRPLPDGDFQSRAGVAGRYLMRAHALYDASRSDRHLPVAEPNWMARRETFATQQQTWRQQINQDPDWRAYHTQNAPAVEAHWQNERVQRLKWAAHVDETMHNQAFAARERQEAQTVAAAPSRSPAQPSRFGGVNQRAPVTERAAAPTAQPAAPPQPRQATPQGRFAQHQGPQLSPQGRPQTPPRDNFARQENSPRDNRQPPAPQGRAAQLRQAAPPAPPPQGQPQTPPRDNFARQDNSPRDNHRQHQVQATPQQQPIAPPQQRVAPPQERAAQMPRRETAPAPQAPPRMAMAPAREPARPQAPASPPPQVHAAPPAPAPHAAPPPHQQAAAAPQAHPAPPHGKDEQGKDDKHKHG